MAEKRVEPKDNGIYNDDQDDLRIISSFDEMELFYELLRGIYAYGYEKPSAIQQRAIAPFTKHRDILAQAQSGTGKTGAFSIGLLQNMDFRYPKKLQGLVLSPTRELTAQTHEVICNFGQYLASSCPGFCQMFVGGTKVWDDGTKLRNGVIVAVGTPGRVADLISNRSWMDVSGMTTVVLDEADELLSQGFHEQLENIFKYLSRTIQIALFSATFGEDVKRLADTVLRNPVKITVNQENLTLEGIKQYYVDLGEDEKLPTLMDLYETFSISQSVIFANSVRKVKWLCEQLNNNNHTVSSIHSEMEKDQREHVFAAFKHGHSRVLVTTDLFARGIDVHAVNIVVNYDLPLDIANYLHRIGRGGRYGKKGVAINFVTPVDQQQLKKIEDYYHTQINELVEDFDKELKA